MAYDPDLVDALEELPQTTWRGEVHRFTTLRHPPERENTLGARWNPRDVPALYMATDRPTLEAELLYALDSWSPRPDPRKLMTHTIRIAVARIVDLREPGLLDRLGVDAATLGSDDMRSCQVIGGAAHWLSIGGLLVPSARRFGGSNLVIFPDRQPGVDYVFDVLASEPASPK